MAKREEFQLLDVDGVTGQVRLTASGGIFNDIFVQIDAVGETKVPVDRIMKMQEQGIGQVVTVLSACGFKKIVGTRAKASGFGKFRQDCLDLLGKLEGTEAPRTSPASSRS